VSKVSTIVLGAADSKLIAIYANYINIVKFRLKLDYRYKITYSTSTLVTLAR
jgi:hypothetical protein